MAMTCAWNFWIYFLHLCLMCARVCAYVLFNCDLCARNCTIL